MLLNEVATARMKRDLAALRRSIEKLESTSAAMQALPDRTPDDDRRIAEGLEVLRQAKERAEVLERFAAGTYHIDCVDEG